MHLNNTLSATCIRITRRSWFMYGICFDKCRNPINAPINKSWQCRHFIVPVWSVLRCPCWQVEQSTVLTLSHSVMMDCWAERPWQGGPHRHISFSHSTGLTRWLCHSSSYLHLCGFKALVCSVTSLLTDWLLYINKIQSHLCMKAGRHRGKGPYTCLAM